MTLAKWFSAVHERFTGRQLLYMQVHHARVQLQLKDPETGIIELHEVRYSAKGAPEFRFAEVSP